MAWLIVAVSGVYTTPQSEAEEPLEDLQSSKVIVLSVDVEAWLTPPDKVAIPTSNFITVFS